MVSIFGDMTVAQRTDEILVHFQFGISDYDVVYLANTTSTLEHVSGKAVLSSGSDTGPARMVSRAPMRFPPGHMAYSIFSASWDNYSEGYAFAGPLCYNGGYFVGFKDGEFVVGKRRNSTDYIVHASEFDYNIITDDPYLSFVLTPEYNNLFCVTYGDMAAAPATFWVLTDIGWVPFHTISNENNSSSVPIGNPSTPVMYEVGGPGNISVSTRAFSAGFAGYDSGVNTRAQGYKRVVSATQSATTTIVVFRMPDTFNGEPNCTMSEMLDYVFFVDAPALGSGTVEFEILANPTITSPGDFTPIEDGESPMEYSINTVIEAGTGKLRAYGPVAFSSQGNVSITTPGKFNARESGLVAVRGDVFALIARNTSTTTVTARAALFWKDKL
jgi:hypothetical protein